MSKMVGMSKEVLIIQAVVTSVWVLFKLGEMTYDFTVKYRKDLRDETAEEKLHRASEAKDYETMDAMKREAEILNLYRTASQRAVRSESNGGKSSVDAITVFKHLFSAGK